MQTNGIIKVRSDVVSCPVDKMFVINSSHVGVFDGMKVTVVKVNDIRNTEDVKEETWDLINFPHLSELYNEPDFIHDHYVEFDVRKFINSSNGLFRPDKSGTVILTNTTWVGGLWNGIKGGVTGTVDGVKEVISDIKYIAIFLGVILGIIGLLVLIYYIRMGTMSLGFLLRKSSRNRAQNQSNRSSMTPNSPELRDFLEQNFGEKKARRIIRSKSSGRWLLEEGEMLRSLDCAGLEKWTFILIYKKQKTFLLDLLLIVYLPF